MEKLDLEDPLPDGAKTIGIIYNLKKGEGVNTYDDEAEYDSIDTINAIKAALETRKHNVILLEADKALPEKLKNAHLDLAFNIAEGFGGRSREAQIPAMLNFFGIPYTGSDATTLCIALDKALTKRLLASYRILTPGYALLSYDSPIKALRLKYPVIVKPNAEGSSKGITDASIVRSDTELINLLNRNFDLYHEPMLAEEYIEGREFTVGIIGNGAGMKVFRPMEIIYKKHTQEDFDVYSYNVKQNYKEYIDYRCPARLTAKQESEMVKTSEKIYNILGCRDFSRIDFRMSSDGNIYFIEINPLPGLAPDYSDYPMLAGFNGVSYNDLINDILEAALIRTSTGNRGVFAI